MKKLLRGGWVAAFGMAFVGTAMSQAASGAPQAADSGAGELEIGTGFDIASGKYGGSARVDELSVPLILRYKTGSLGYKLTVPFLRVAGPADAVPLDGGTVICTDSSGSGGGNSGPGSRNSGRGSLDDCDDDNGVPGSASGSQRSTRSGLGDVQLEITYELPEFREGGPTLELTGKIKLGTASASKGLGTGKNSYSLQADAAQPFGNFSVLGGIGYRVYEKITGAALKNTPFVALGGKWRFGDATSVKLVYDRRWPVEAGSVHAAELTATLEHELGRNWRLETYLLKGITNASADLGAGLVIARQF